MNILRSTKQKQLKDIVLKIGEKIKMIKIGVLEAKIVKFSQF